jgi:hypothetical protein
MENKDGNTTKEQGDHNLIKGMRQLDKNIIVDL